MKRSLQTPCNYLRVQGVDLLENGSEFPILNTFRPDFEQPVFVFVSLCLLLSVEPLTLLEGLLDEVFILLEFSDQLVLQNGVLHEGL